MLEYFGNRAEKVAKLPLRHTFHGESWVIGGITNMYAVIETGGKQYKVQQGDTVFVEKLNAEAGENVIFDKVLVVGGDDLKVGTPYVNGVTVSATVAKQGKAKKLLFISTSPKRAITKSKATDSPTPKLKLPQSMVNFVD